MKRIVLLCLAALLLMPGVAMAHSRLENAVPAQDTTVKSSPERIELTFNTAIEELSNFKLLNAAGEEIATDNKTVEGSTMSAGLPESLGSGVYTVKWAIIGADGHSVEGEYAFTVEVPAVTDEPTSAPSPSAEAEPETPAETTNESETPSPDTAEDANAANEADISAAAGNDGTNYAPAIIIGAIIVAAALVLFLRRRKP